MRPPSGESGSALAIVRASYSIDKITVIGFQLDPKMYAIKREKCATEDPTFEYKPIN
jgi:hypothetical protein